jgi:hypothetical protein
MRTAREDIISVKRIGKAKLDLKSELWGIEGKPDKFLINKRLISKNADVKAFRHEYDRFVNGKKPSKRRQEDWKVYLKARSEMDRRLMECLDLAYKEILQESFQFPVPMCRDRDYDHKSDWRYCLYKGVVYQFDKPGLSMDAMSDQIEAYERPKISTP